jgi:hypothetical protein
MPHRTPIDAWPCLERQFCRDDKTAISLDQGTAGPQKKQKIEDPPIMEPLIFRAATEAGHATHPEVAAVVTPFIWKNPAIEFEVYPSKGINGFVFNDTNSPTLRYED